MKHLYKTLLLSGALLTSCSTEQPQRQTYEKPAIIPSRSEECNRNTGYFHKDYNCLFEPAPDTFLWAPDTSRFEQRERQ